jgi:hypothetical protein
MFIGKRVCASSISADTQESDSAHVHNFDQVKPLGYSSLY